MKLYLKRYKTPTYCIGKLSIDGEYFCDTCEDRDRGLTQDMTLAEIKQRKVAGTTAIPTGTYTISMNIVSPSYSKKPYYKKLCAGRVPRLMNVPGFDGILIHIGNTAKDSAGCILVGQNKKKGMVLNSRVTFESLYSRLKSASNNGESISITIE